MKSTISKLIPQRELEGVSALRRFIEGAKGLSVLMIAEQFEKSIWEVAGFKGKNGRNRVIFCTLDAARECVAVPLLCEEFIDFAKAMVLELNQRRPVVSHGQRITALRCLEAALKNNGKGGRPTAVDKEVLDAAVEVATEHYSSGVAYRVAGQLELIAEMMVARGIASMRSPWNHGLKKPADVGSRISKEALKARQEKLPSRAALKALGAIYRDSIGAPDVLVSSALAIMLCAPERINEVVRLERNCMVLGEGEYSGFLGIRWKGSKNFADSIKWLPSEMTDVARGALLNLHRITEFGHRISSWYTEHPDELYLSEDVIQLRGKDILSLAEIRQVLWGDGASVDAAYLWATVTHNLKKQQIVGGRVGFLFRDVEAAVLSMLPKSFPYVPGDSGLLLCESLFVARANEMHSGKATYQCMFKAVDQNMITSAFCGNPGRPTSIFERFGFREDDGSSIKLKSHSLRHYLNMLAQTGGMSSAEIALFSGRKDVRQNRAYDHMTSCEVQAPISEAMHGGLNSELDPSEKMRHLFLRPEFRGIGVPAAHTTEYGWCHHNFASEPCQMYRDCINCEEHECIKGESHKLDNLRKLKDETELLLNRARDALKDEAYGADLWVAHQAKTLDRVVALLEVMENPMVPLGSRIRLSSSNTPLIATAAHMPLKIARRPRKRRG
jgi:hypothetical protein